MNSSFAEASTCTVKYFNGMNVIRLINRPVHAYIYIHAHKYIYSCSYIYIYIYIYIHTVSAKNIYTHFNERKRYVV
jgi:hypothetical protein